MSRLSKEVQLDGRRVTVFELTVKDIKKLWADAKGGLPTGQETENKDVRIFDTEAVLKKHWDKCISGLTLEESEEYAPSELKLIYDAFYEVNKIFFDLALKLEGENPLVLSLRTTLMLDLLVRYVALSKRDTEESGVTDTPSL